MTPAPGPVPQPGWSELAEERDFLLRSIRDLDAERQAGDLDESDYRSLHKWIVRVSATGLHI